MVTNWGGSLTVAAPSAPLMTSPGGTVFRDDNFNMIHDDGEPTGPFDLAAAYESGATRLIVQAGSPYQIDGVGSRDNGPLLQAFLRWLTEEQ